MGRLLAERLHGEGDERDPLTYRALIWAMEAASLELLAGAASAARIEHAKTVLGDLLISALCRRST